MTFNKQYAIVFFAILNCLFICWFFFSAQYNRMMVDHLPTDAFSSTGLENSHFHTRFEEMSKRVDYEKQLFQYVIHKDGIFSNWPLELWNSSSIGGVRNKCVKFPKVHEVRFNTDYWQKMESENGTFYLFGAYFDNRPKSPGKPTVRILGQVDRYLPSVKTYCYIWFEDGKQGIMVPVTNYHHVWHSYWGRQMWEPYLITCELPEHNSSLVPIAVSLVAKPCDTPTTSLLVHYNRVPEKEIVNFGVCVRGLFFHKTDMSSKIVEWLEFLFEMGVSKVHFYKFYLHPNMEKVLQYYEMLGKIEVLPMSHPVNEPNAPQIRILGQFYRHQIMYEYRKELFSLNDCFYRNMYRYRYVALLDIDEVIVPRKVYNWEKLLETLHLANKKENSNPTSYCFRNIFFSDDIQPKNISRLSNVPSYMHILRNTQRSNNYSKPGHSIKCIHRTDKILALHNHYPISCLNTSCYNFDVPYDIARLHHYRIEVDAFFKNSSINDTTVWKYKRNIISRVSKVLKDLYFTEE